MTPVPTPTPEPEDAESREQKQLLLEIHEKLGRLAVEIEKMPGKR